MKKTLFLFIIIFVSTESYAQPGNSGLAFLKLGVGSRGLAMGEAYTAIAGDPTALHFNPAALSLSKTTQILLMHRRWFQDAKTDFISAKASIAQFTVGVAVNATSVENIEIRTTPGTSLGTFSARNAAIGIGAAYEIDQSVCIGMTANYIYEKIYIQDAQGIGINVGILYCSPWDIRFALAVNNLGTMSKLNHEATKLPTQIRFGSAYEIGIKPLNSIVTTAVDIVSSTKENKSHVNLGAELTFDDIFSTRLGYQTGYAVRNFSTGVGVRYTLFHFDYAFAPSLYNLGSAHTFTVKVEF